MEVRCLLLDLEMPITVSIDSKRSISGDLFKLRNSIISWQSQKQKFVSTSTIDAEYIAHSKAAKHFL
jgi:hypothetical protein